MPINQGKLMSKVSRVLILSFCLSLLMPAAWASAIGGSSAISRLWTDGAAGQVEIYAGGFFPALTQITTFSIFGHSFTGTRDVTPVIFEVTSPGVYTVRGVGTGQAISASSVMQMFAFGLQYGSSTTTNANYTFGFLNGFVNGSGTQTASTAGAVDFDTPVVTGSTGVGGAGTTNNWVFTPTISNINLALGTTFQMNCGGAANCFALNNPSLGGFSDYRTYSGFVTNDVPEPGSVTFAALGSAVILGMALYRKRRKV